MEFGCHLPVYGATATRDVTLGFARRMESLGYDAVWASDHVVLPEGIESRYPYDPSGRLPLPLDTPFLEPLVTLALVAGATERLRLGTSILVLPHRHPVLVAKMLATLDHLAPGRVIAGVGVGWMREEIELFGVPYARRGAWSDEAIEVMRACWTRERPAFSGQFFRFGPLGFAPRPARGTIPVWVGGNSSAALHRAARLGDGWHGTFLTAKETAAVVERLRAACREAGRDPATLTLSIRVGLPARRPAAELVEQMQALAALGVRHVLLETRVTDLDGMVATYERFAGEVRARL